MFRVEQGGFQSRCRLPGTNSGETSPNAVSGESHLTRLLVQVGSPDVVSIQDNAMKRRTLALWKGSPEKVEGQTNIGEEKPHVET